MIRVYFFPFPAFLAFGLAFLQTIGSPPFHNYFSAPREDIVNYY
jgi:hypothetical protein